MAETAVTSNLGWDNFFSTTTTGALTATTTTIPLATPPTPTEGFLVLDPGGANEIIFYNSVSGNNVIVPSTDDRGRGDSTAQAHSSGITVKMNTVGMMFEALQSGLALTDSAITTAKIADANVTSEKLNATIACKAYRSAAFNITGAGGVEKIPLDAESFDLGSDWDTTNGRFVTPVTGYYQVNATIRATSVNANGVLVVEIDVDGGAVAYNSSPGTVNAQSMSCSISDIIYATSGQYIELYGDCSTTEAVTTGAANTFMSIYFIGV